MKKLLFIGFILSITTVACLYAYVQRYGDPRAALLPVKIEKKVNLPAKLGKPLDINLQLPSGFTAGIFAEDITGVRDLVFSPKGALIASIPSEGKIVMLLDKNHDGIADGVDNLIDRLNNPHGIVFYNNMLYVAEETKVSRYIWSDSNYVGGVARIEKKLFDLPKGGRHTTRTIVFDKKGTMYVSIGSTCDVCNEQNPFQAAVIVSDAEGKNPRLFAKGLRNSTFITVNPETQELWGTEMGRDFLGDNSPPDEINIINDGKDYGWPVCYGNKLHDTDFDKRQYIQDPCLNTVAPIFEIPAHSAPLGLTFIDSQFFPEDWQGDLLVAYHGSWNRSSPIGYKVVHMKVNGNKILSSEDFITGFLQDDGTSAGRPVDLIFDSEGNLYLSDDKAGRIYIVTKK